jgi:hypothetical protein
MAVEAETFAVETSVVVSADSGLPVLPFGPAACQGQSSRVGAAAYIAALRIGLLIPAILKLIGANSVCVMFSIEYHDIKVQ